MKSRFRAFVSLLLAPAFILVSLSGLVLYAGPAGRFAEWSNWTFIGLSKANWGDLHITVSILLLVVAVLHWCLNWSTFWRYIKGKASRLNLRMELAAAAVVLAFAIVGTLIQIPPFSSTLSLSKFIKNCWSQRLPEPPISKSLRSEEFEPRQLVEIVGLPVEDVVAALRKEGFVVTEPDATIRQIADENGLAPVDVFTALEKNQRPEAGTDSPDGKHGQRP